MTDKKGYGRPEPSEPHAGSPGVPLTTGDEGSGVRVLNGVRGVFSASHTDPMTGQMHGHDYEVIAHFNGDPLRRFEVLRETLNAVLAAWDHTVMPEELWSAEAIGKALIQLLDLRKVEVNRPAIGHFVTVEA